MITGDKLVIESSGSSRTESSPAPLMPAQTLKAAAHSKDTLPKQQETTPPQTLEGRVNIPKKSNILHRLESMDKKKCIKVS